jgi:hypothetical protein
MAQRLGAATAAPGNDIADDVAADVVMRRSAAPTHRPMRSGSCARGSGGRLGVFSSTPTLPALALLAKEVRIAGWLIRSHQSAPRFPVAIDLIRQHAEPRTGDPSFSAPMHSAGVRDGVGQARRVRSVVVSP